MVCRPGSYDIMPPLLAGQTIGDAPASLSSSDASSILTH